MLERKPLIVVSGCRRVGKTSLILVALNELNVPYVFVDTRGLPPNPSARDIYERVCDGFSKLLESRRTIADSLRKYLEMVRGVEVLGFSISIAWSKRERVDLIALFDSLDRWARDRGTQVVVVIDEAQRIGGVWARVLAEVIAHIYDHAEATTVIVSGSEVGVLHRFLGIDDAEHPLYGRYFSEVKLPRFNRYQSEEFLVKGFEQMGYSPPHQFIEHAVDSLDGIVGWLVELGLRCIEMRRFDDLAILETLERASKLALSELEHLLSTRPIEARRRYLEVLKAISCGYDTWSSIQRFVESRLGRYLPKSVLSNILRNLQDMSLIEKVVNGRNVRYRIVDPVLRYALSKHYQ